MDPGKDQTIPRLSRGRLLFLIISLGAIAIAVGLSVLLLFSNRQKQPEEIPIAEKPPAVKPGGRSSTVPRPEGTPPPPSKPSEPSPHQTVTTDPILPQLDLALRQGKCEKADDILGPGSNQDGSRSFFSVFFYSTGVKYWKEKEYLYAANVMECHLERYPDYRDEALIVLVDSQIEIGDFTLARKNLGTLARDFPHQKEEIEKLQRKYEERIQNRFRQD